MFVGMYVGMKIGTYDAETFISGEGNVALYATPNPFLLNKICLNQTFIHLHIYPNLSSRNTTKRRKLEQNVYN